MTMHRATALTICLLFASTACQSNSYTSSISLTGADSQSALAKAVERSIERQAECEGEFAEAFLRLQALQQAEAESLGALFGDFREQVDACALRVQRAEQDIDATQEKGALLFDSWTAELAEFSSESMRARSEARLLSVQQGLENLILGQQRAQTQMGVLLSSYRDYVLFFNHNLGTHSNGDLEGENALFESQLERLRDDLGLVRREGSAFVRQLQGAGSTRVEAMSEDAGQPQG